MTPKSVARELFAFGVGKEKKWNQNEKNLAPAFHKTQTTIGAFQACILLEA